MLHVPWPLVTAYLPGARGYAVDAPLEALALHVAGLDGLAVAAHGREPCQKQRRQREHGRGPCRLGAT
jgi:hypothetical protein